MKNRLIKNSFTLSLLLHLLLLFSLIYYVRFQPEENKKKPSLYVPSYVYTGAVKPTLSSSQPMPATRAATISHAASPQQKSAPPQKAIAVRKDGIGLREIMASSYRYLEENQRQVIHSMVSDAEPIYMIGDINEQADPLIILLGRAISKHFQYPEMAGKFGISGRVLVKITLLPEGNIINVIVVKSSNNHDLDSAALYAVNTAPKIIGADNYIKKPKTVVIGFLFNIGPPA